MPTAEAHVPTDRPSRYLVQLCKHFSNKGSHLSHRPRNHGGGDGPDTARRHTAPDIDPSQISVEWSDTHGTVTLPWGTCDLRAAEGDLVLRVEADTEEDLRRLQDLLAMHLGRFGRRDQLQVEWQEPAAATAAPSPPAEQSDSGSVRPPRARLDHLKWAGLAALILLVVAVHLGLADALLSTSDWTSWAVGAVLAVIVVKLAAVLVVGRRLHRRSRRRA
ncbi:hypothetical protein GCM10022403_005160 [Streptomyces coacervatus]|uniref:DUF2218 domain-containing protein n=1 Tax=Streptomyces coacervatus TaxID=647381 RepID=A0ABP7GTG3_9ACTN|nr:DUF2218 domain-containing protein [Streptomyces coacervatus]MDF2264984.1 DUF2218 domain-containing protein [Streptomyces coacervatus]